MSLVRCTDCYFMIYLDNGYDEEMDCANGNATPENGAPKMICDEPHHCPFWEPQDDGD